MNTNLIKLNKQIIIFYLLSNLLVVLLKIKVLLRLFIYYTCHYLFFYKFKYLGVIEIFNFKRSMCI